MRHRKHCVHRRKARRRRKRRKQVIYAHTAPTHRSTLTRPDTAKRANPSPLSPPATASAAHPLAVAVAVAVAGEGTERRHGAGARGRPHDREKPQAARRGRHRPPQDLRKPLLPRTGSICPVRLGRSSRSSWLGFSPVDSCSA